MNDRYIARVSVRYELAVRQAAELTYRTEGGCPPDPEPDDEGEIWADECPTMDTQIGWLLEISDRTGKLAHVKWHMPLGDDDEDYFELVDNCTAAPEPAIMKAVKMAVSWLND